MGAQRRFYTDQFKEEAVKLAESVGIAKAAKDLGINATNITRWRKGPQATPSEPTATPTIAELQKENMRLKKELRYAYEVTEILKKSLGIVSPQPRGPLL